MKKSGVKKKVIMVEMRLEKSTYRYISQDSWERLNYVFDHLLTNGDTVIAQLMFENCAIYDKSSLEEQTKGWKYCKINSNTPKSFDCLFQMESGKTYPGLLEAAKKWNVQTLVMEEPSSHFRRMINSFNPTGWSNYAHRVGEIYSKTLPPQCNLLILKGSLCKWERFITLPVIHRVPIQPVDPLDDDSSQCDSSTSTSSWCDDMVPESTWTETETKETTSHPEYPALLSLKNSPSNAETILPRWIPESPTSSSSLGFLPNHAPPPVPESPTPSSSSGILPNRAPPPVPESPIPSSSLEFLPSRGPPVPECLSPANSRSLLPNRSPPPVPDSFLPTSGSSVDNSLCGSSMSTSDRSINDGFYSQLSIDPDPCLTKNSETSSHSSIAMSNSIPFYQKSIDSKSFSHDDIIQATQGFSDEMKIGEGGFGVVYKGHSDYFGKIAVKIIKQETKDFALKQLETELILLQKFNHKNLVKLHGFSVIENKLHLIFEFAEGGSLKSRISNANLPPLTWKERIQIIHGSAEGLKYLHSGLSQPIIHRDIKSENILLTDNLVPKIADFGLAKETPKDQENTWMFPETMVFGSNGYIAPEYVANAQGTKNIDVYAFGVVILEILTGKPAFSKSLNPRSLKDYVKRHLNSGAPITDLADPRLEGQFDEVHFEVLTLMAIQCCKNNPNKRPKIEHVALQVELL